MATLVNTFHYFIEGLTVNELSHIQIHCSDRDLLKFSPPPGQTCGNYTANFFGYGATEYIDNPDAVQPELCGYCPFKNGEEFYYSMFFVFGILVYWKHKDRR